MFLDLFICDGEQNVDSVPCLGCVNTIMLLVDKAEDEACDFYTTGALDEYKY